MSARPTLTASVSRLVTALRCAAVDHRVGGILFIGLPPAMLRHLGQWLAAAIDPASTVVMLGAGETDEDLWWRLGGPVEGGQFRFEPGPGPLVEPPRTPPPVIVVPDLARASLAVTRAAVTLIGTDTATADRHGRHIQWQPRARWIAACARADLDGLSRHLLDRFAVRIDAAGVATVADPGALRDLLDADDDGTAALLDLPTFETGRDNRQPLPPLTQRASLLVIEMLRDVAAPHRRDLALARMARALAALEGYRSVTHVHVRQAANLLDIGRPADEGPVGPAAPSPTETTSAHPPRADEPVRAGPVSDDAPDVERDLQAGAALAASGDAVAVPVALLPAGNYPEDDPDSLPEYASLREPWQRRKQSRATRGQVIGTEPTRGLTDIALVATLFEAAKYQQMRVADPSTRMRIWGSDLRRHRRQARPDTAVVFVLDHTSRRGWDWSPALAPYLRWVYTQRAALTVVEFGHKDSQDELRAVRYRASSILDRRIMRSLDRPVGSASPLAYALDLAVQELRRRLRFGEAAAERAWLVVASDGRGNVPMEVSQRGRVAGPVGRQGVEDALVAASGVRSLPGVRAVVLAPPDLTHYAGLPFELATAMGGIVAEPERVDEVPS